MNWAKRSIQNFNGVIVIGQWRPAAQKKSLEMEDYSRAVFLGNPKPRLDEDDPFLRFM